MAWSFGEESIFLHCISLYCAHSCDGHSGCRSQLSSRKVHWRKTTADGIWPIWFRQKMVQKKNDFKGEMRINHHIFFRNPILRHTRIKISQSSCIEDFGPHKLGVWYQRCRNCLCWGIRRMDRRFTNLGILFSYVFLLCLQGKENTIERSTESWVLDSLWVYFLFHNFDPLEQLHPFFDEAFLALRCLCRDRLGRRVLRGLWDCWGEWMGHGDPFMDDLWDEN